MLLLFDSGGVRLHEANAGLIAVSEMMRAVLRARLAGVPFIGLIGGAGGCFGGTGLIARCCDVLVMSEEGRLGMSGPEVIETTRGVEEFDSRDRALVWRVTGGKHRYLLGEVDRLVEDDIACFRAAAIDALESAAGLSLAEVEASTSGCSSAGIDSGDAMMRWRSGQHWVCRNRSVSRCSRPRTSSRWQIRSRSAS